MSKKNAKSQNDTYTEIARNAAQQAMILESNERLRKRKEYLRREFTDGICKLLDDYEKKLRDGEQIENTRKAEILIHGHFS